MYSLLFQLHGCACVSSIPGGIGRGRGLMLAELDHHSLEAGQSQEANPDNSSPETFE